jgi:hypothetical protein
VSYKIPFTKEELESTPLCLNIGSGRDYRRPQVGDKLWVNIDADPKVGADANLPLDQLHEVFEDKVLLIIAKDILEHVLYTWEDQEGYKRYLESWVRCLKPGGKIEIQVPDIHQLIEGWRRGDFDEANLLRFLYGEDLGLDRHYQVFTLGRLRSVVESMGLKVVKEQRLGICCMVEGYKVPTT